MNSDCKIPRLKSLSLLIILFVLLSPLLADAAVKTVRKAPRMRPYSGAGVLTVPLFADIPDDFADPLLLYHEPGLGRLGGLDLARVPRHEWLFGVDRERLQLVVTARKGKWSQVVYDDAGREGWFAQQRFGYFQAWDSFLKGRIAYLLPGLQKRYYQFFRQGYAVPVAVTAAQNFKVIMVEGDWAVALQEPNQLGRLRWRDEDGRLLIGLQ